MINLDNITTASTRQNFVLRVKQTLGGPCGRNILSGIGLSQLQEPVLIEVKSIDDKDIKSEITRRFMHALPKWFSPPEDIERKALIHRAYPFFVASENGKVVGFLTLRIHNQFTGEIYNLGVLEEVHRKGVGHQLVQAAEEYLVRKIFGTLLSKHSTPVQPTNPMIGHAHSIPRRASSLLRS